MSQDTCILTTKDFTIVEVMRERCLDLSDPLRPLLDRKIGTARVIFREDAPPTLATISSRITYSTNSRRQDTRILSHGRINSPTGLFLPIATLRGLALLGMQEGQEFTYLNRDGEAETARLETVHYQPEAARREKEAAERLATPAQRRAMLRVVSNAEPSSPGRAQPPFDDPGPSAA